MITKKKSCSADRIWKNHPSKKMDFSSINRLLQKFRETGSMERRHGSSRLRTVSTEENMALIEELVCSQEERHHAHLAPRKITEQKGISWSSIRRMMEKRKHETVQELENTTNV